MSRIKFELNGLAWEQALIELVPPPGWGGEAWWRRFEDLTDQAARLSGAHLCLRIMQAARQPARRWFGVTVPANTDGLASWLKAAATLNDAAGGSMRMFDASSPEHAGWLEAPAYVTGLSTQAYVLSGLPVACDYRVHPLLESLAIDAAARGFGWCYQLNATAQPLAGEELRAARKNLVRLESLPRLPARLLEQQRRILASAERCQWRCAEFVGAADRAAFLPATRRLTDDFEGIYGRAGFEALAWPDATSDDSADAWESGLHPAAIAPGAAEISPATMIERDTLRSVWTTRLPGPADSAVAAPRPANATDAPPVVFLSYSSPDRAAAFATCAALEANGLRCWIAPRDILPGKEWAEAIVQGINASRVTVVLVSPKSNLSKHVLREIERSVHANHPIVPVRLEHFHLSEAFGYFLSTHHWFDAYTPPYESHLQPLVAQIKRILA